MAGCLLEFAVEVFFRVGFEYLVFGGTSKSGLQASRITEDPDKPGTRLSGQ